MTAGQITEQTSLRDATPGPFMSSPLPIAGFAIIEAADLDAAVAMVAATPFAVAHGVVEV